MSSKTSWCWGSWEAEQRGAPGRGCGPSDDNPGHGNGPRRKYQWFDENRRNGAPGRQNKILEVIQVMVVVQIREMSVMT